MANLPIPDEQTYVLFPAAAGMGPFPFNFSLFAKADLRVTLGTAELAQTDFTFSGIAATGGYDGGSITLNIDADGQDLAIWRVVTPARANDYAPANFVPVASIDQALDRLTAHAQDARRDLDRCLMVGLGEDPVGFEDVVDAAQAVAGKANTDLGNLVSASIGRAALRIREYRTPKDMGAAEDGITNDATPVFNANALGKPILFTAASTRIATALDLTVPVEIAPGAQIKVDGVQLRFFGEFAASLQKVFDCINGGSVVFGFGVLDASYAEWWGANADGVTDSTAAINASLQASSKTVLLRGTYKVTSAIVVNTDNTSLIGAGAGITVLSSNSLTDDVVRVTGSGSTLISNTVLRGFSTARTVTPTTPGVGLEYTGGAGVRTSKAARFFYDDISCYNDVIGFYFNNTAAGVGENLLAVKNQVGVAGDKWYGFWNDGSIASVTPGLTPNASLRLNNATASVTGFVGTSRGLYGLGAIADWFLFQPEAGGCTTSLDLAPSAGYYDAIDVHVIQPIFDNITTTGIKIAGLSVYGAIHIVGGYVSLGANGATACYGVDISGAIAVKVLGLQVMNVLGATAAVGVRVTNGRRVTVESCTFKDVTFGVVFASSSYCRQVNNSMERNGAIAATGYGVSVTGGSNNTIDMDIGGDTNSKYTVGVAFDNTTASNYVNLTGIALGPCVNKMSINGVTVTAVGLNGTHWITGTLT